MLCGEFPCGFGKSTLFQILSLLTERLLMDRKVVICVPTELLQEMVVRAFPTQIRLQAIVDLDNPDINGIFVITMKYLN